MPPGSNQLQEIYVYEASSTGPTSTFTVSNNTFDVNQFCTTVSLQTARMNRDIEADEIRRDRTINRKERRRKLAQLRKGKR